MAGKEVQDEMAKIRAKRVLVARFDAVLARYQATR